MQCPQVLKTLLVGRQYGLQVARIFDLSCLRGVELITQIGFMLLQLERVLQK